MNSGTKQVDEYISRFPPKAQKLLQQLRATIRKAAPDAEEVISYAMPGYKLHGLLVCFAGYSKHIGFYPTPSAIAAFQEQLASYKKAKGSVQFPLNNRLPLTVIAAMIKFKRKENIEKWNSLHPRG
jgi:uncharacterized protein YdhG (YjbR/CyaY superfamily)